ncbi:MAG: hypothetical protein NC310_01265 [Roseburia sp.]|nr:hypothetical protein [Anaeroplasma bactoclasticum]MCM1195683.1 hypothetical protein [Roseburia sp.]MCM1556349.1 hypothetical protein [Anaeroplasma bactoclasticum]
MENTWRFPGNGYTQDQGLDTSDMETFKKDPIASLARELCQNSIDARRENVKGPVRIEFKSFSIKREEIPQVELIEKQLLACKETWDSNKKISDQLDKMVEQIKKDKIECLRISDFNTKGLVGVSGGDNTPWHYMVHGSGLSNKSATSGGSKGIGKFATFVTSHFNTVFYSTVTEEKEKGYQGICKLCSAKQEGTTEKTIGIGYFGSSVKNEPIVGEFDLDKEYKRKGKTGTDIFILGFKNPTGWKEDIISKILESFISAIVYEDLEVVVDDIILNKENLQDIVYNEELINKSNRKSVISQYILLTDVEHRYEGMIQFGSLGQAKLYLMEFDAEHEYLATNGCVMIRHPLMKIRDIEKITTLPCSAMCIIENNEVNALLRNIENPQHTNWEFNRIEEDSKRAEIRALYKHLLDEIKRLITEHLMTSDNFQTEVAGAGNFIPGTEDEDKESDIQKGILDTPTITTKKVKSTNLKLNAYVEDENGEEEIEIVEQKELLSPSQPRSTGNLGFGVGERRDDLLKENHTIMKVTELKGMSYYLMCVNKKMRMYAIVFTSNYDERDVILELYALDDSGTKMPVSIFAGTINGAQAQVLGRRKIKFSMSKNQRIKIEMITDQAELFSSEVRVYARR